MLNRKFGASKSPTFHILTVASNLNKNDENLESVIEKLSKKSGLTIANARNILTQNQDWDVAEYLKIKPADLDCLISSEASFLFAEKLGITKAELQNLIDELGNSFITGIIFSKIMYENE